MSGDNAARLRTEHDGESDKRNTRWDSLIPSCVKRLRDHRRNFLEEMMGDWLICAAIYVLIAVNIIDMGRKRKS